MRNRVPLAGAWWQMAHRELKTGFMSDLWQLGLPEPGPVPVAAAAVSRDQQTPGVGIDRLPHRGPPAPDARDGKRRGVMIRSPIHPSCMLRLVVHPRWSDLAQLGNRKIMATDSLRGSLRPQLPSLIGAIPYQLLLVRLHRNGGVVQGLKGLDRLVNMLKLGLAVRMRAPLERLAVGRQAIAHVLRTTYYAIGTETLMALMTQAGFQDVQRLEARFYQPVIIGTKP